MTEEPPKDEWEISKGLALRITMDFFKLCELRNAIADVPAMAQVLIRANLSHDDFEVIVHAMELQHTIIAARLRLNVEAYRVFIE